MVRGIFYNSKKSLCSIYESGKMCYEALNRSNIFTLDYSEDRNIDYNYDFIIYNQHFTVNNWITKDIVKNFNKPIFCIVTEIAFDDNIISCCPSYFTGYIVLDPTVQDRDNIYGFCRPLEDILCGTYVETNIPIIGSFGFATAGKEWHKIVEIVQNEFTEAYIRFNIPKATYVSSETHNILINEMNYNINKIKSPKIIIEITHNELTKQELIEWCSKNTINIFIT